MSDRIKDRDPPLFDQRPPQPGHWRNRRPTLIEEAEAIDHELAAGIRKAKRCMFPDLNRDDKTN